jgi:hypothetical protein
MPLMAAVKAVCSHVPDWKPWANLMSSHEEIPEASETTEPAEATKHAEPAEESSAKPAAAEPTGVDLSLSADGQGVESPAAVTRER